MHVSARDKRLGISGTKDWNRNDDRKGKHDADIVDKAAGELGVEISVSDPLF
jgi:hypothetical protein